MVGAASLAQRYSSHDQAAPHVEGTVAHYVADLVDAHATLDVEVLEHFFFVVVAESVSDSLPAFFKNRNGTPPLYEELQECL